MAYDYSGASSKPKTKSKKLDAVLARLLELEQSENIAETLTDEDEEGGLPGLTSIGYEVEKKYQIDKKSREDWERSADKAMNIALQVRQPKNYPFENAANIKYPLVTVAALQFGARAYPAIVDGNRIVKAQVLGRDDGVPATGPDGQPIMIPGPPGPDGQPQPVPQWKLEPGAKRAQADRVSAHMSYQLLNEMEEWEEDTDVLLHHLPIVGCCFRKVWRSAELCRNKSEMVPAIHLVVNNRVRSLNEPVPVTHEIYLYPQEIEERQRNKTFLDVELPRPTSIQKEGEVVDESDEDAPHLFLEQHRYIDLDGDGYREPYIVTVHKDTCKVVRIVANFRMEEIKHDDKQIIRIPKEQYFVKYSFIPDPKGGFYDIGFGKLLESLSETIDTTINQMLDAGHLQNAGGGFISTAIRLKKNKITVSPGKYEQVEVTGGDVRTAIYSHQFPGPSAVLFNLLGMMVDAARDITAVKDILTGDTGEKGVQTATTTLAMIEQGLKVFTAIYKRVYRSLKDEFKLLFRLNAQHATDQEYFTFLDQQQAIAKADYDLKSMDIMPVADPKMVTDMQRAARANVLMQISGSPLGVMQNPQEALKRVYDSVGMEEAEKLIVQQQGPSPAEQLAMMQGMSEVEKNKAAATKDEALAAAALVEAQLAPLKFEHEGHMAENKARIEAAQVEQQGQQAADAADRADRHKAVDVGLENERMDREEVQAERLAAEKAKVKSVG
jgi:chaperonin GroES